MAKRPSLLERLRAGWASMASTAAAFDAPIPGDVAAMAAARAGLEAFFQRDPARLDASLLHGRPLRATRADRELLQSLEALGLVSRAGLGIYTPCVRLIRLDGRWIATDLLRRGSVDQVFTIMFEQVYMIRNMQVASGADVLELCTGSGVLSLFAADPARQVTAVDVSPRALAFARFNLALNACTTPITLLEGSLFSPLETGQRFDHVLVNPPFEPVPPDTEFFLHSGAGEDGLDVVRKVLAGLPERLRPEGRMTMITWSPGTEDGPLLADLAREVLPTHRLRLDVLESGPLAPVLERFEEAEGYADWRERLASRGLTTLYFVCLDATPSEAPGLTLRHPVEEVAACHAIADAWL